MPLDNERPESFLGLIAGLEGVSDGCTVIHGPTGCKYYPASMSEAVYRRSAKGLPMNRNVLRLGFEYFFGQPRVPCTYLDMDTFVSGAPERLREAYSRAEALGPGFIAVVNSPGASLVGEDLTCISGKIPTARIDHAGYSKDCSDGFQQAVLSVLETIVPRKAAEHRGVNLLGISILHLNWQDTIDDLSSLLALCGIEVNMCVGAGWSSDDIRRSSEAELNVLVYPEYGDRIASYYEKEHGIPCYVPEEGAPVGFGPLESWVRGICSMLGKDPAPALARIAGERKRTAAVLRSAESCHMLPKARTYSLYCDGSTAFAVSRFLYGYLGMVPVAIRCPNGPEWEAKARKDFDDWHIPVSDDPENTPADVLVASGAIGAALVKKGTVQGVAAVEGPGIKFAHIDPEPPIGLRGTVMLAETVINLVADRQRFR